MLEGLKIFLQGPCPSAPLRLGSHLACHLPSQAGGWWDPEEKRERHPLEVTSPAGVDMAEASVSMAKGSVGS